MITESPIWLPRCRLKPYAHQITGVQRIVRHPYFLLADEQGVGKTMQAILAAQVLYALNKIDRVLIVTPSSVRGVWYDEEFGELSQCLWPDITHSIVEFHERERGWVYGDSKHKPMTWFVTNYDFIRSKHRIQQLSQFCNHRTMLICDESSKIKNYRAKQTRAVKTLRWKCDRVLMLNGTPIANSPRDMYSQGNILHPSILDTKFVYQFDARYAIKAKVGNRTWDDRWRNLEDMQARFAPFTLRRLKTDCLDLPPKLPPVILNATLTPIEWKHYCAMRDDLITWLESPEATSMASQAIIKVLRLSQITAGFLGGVVTSILESDAADAPFPELEAARVTSEVRELGHSKLDVFLEWFEDQLAADPNLKLLAWCRFRPELARAAAMLSWQFPHVAVRMLHGGQRKLEREEALRLLDARTAPSGPAVLIGTPESGAMGHTFVAAHTVIYLSDSYSLLNYLQTQDRVHRPGQTMPVGYYHILASGPNGERTIDHVVFKALKAKESLAKWTTDAWRDALAA